MVYQWRDKVVIITGAATGIGEAVVRRLMDESINHVAVLDVDESNGKSLQQESITKYGANKVKFYKCDVINDDQLFSVFNSVKIEQGAIDVVINNAGIMNDSWETYKKEIAINVGAFFFMWESRRPEKGAAPGSSMDPGVYPLNPIGLPLAGSESAAQGVIDAYKLGESGSTWLVNAGEPAADITSAVTRAYEIMSEGTSIIE
ncbi:dehydrogenase/reductase SDR family member 11-like [Hyposmocoma kahamanoa]|uniref:dehydrogenase/reductase SDR family member 11-like n=1 Tax=Hyposmocoma kahamanoa TaxID=1477025 RepID=UPI000E6D7A04|nr:dehydrogenase/reductase SDR family member 11-like [Hyposmocoma kahamanoa]